LPQPVPRSSPTPSQPPPCTTAYPAALTQQLSCCTSACQATRAHQHQRFAAAAAAVAHDPSLPTIQSGYTTASSAVWLMAW
jgi:hypothetical protein